MQAVAAGLSGHAGKFRCLLEIRVQKQLFRFTYSEHLPTTISWRPPVLCVARPRRDMVLGFLARNELVASAFA
jgi:hypothetical protein